MQRARQSIPVQVEPNNLLAAARSGGEVSAGRVGNSINASGPPVIKFETENGFPYLLDIVPNPSGARVINLTANADKSAVMCIMTSYDSTTQFEQNTGVLESVINTPVRSHSLLVQFGAGNVRHSYEIDVAEGSTGNVPGSHMEVTLLDYSFQRGGDNSIPSNQITASTSRALISHANIAAGSHPFPARITTKVFCPFQVLVDLADPPSFTDFLDQLVNALAFSEIVTVVP